MLYDYLLLGAFILGSMLFVALIVAPIVFALDRVNEDGDAWAINYDSPGND
jgi:Na+/serine symporter